ncbi:hypothetical protein PF002_g18191 [Phytophthora fragariae]|uniref:Uncharacterized protein n=1 Tax=Phytophthora fragariae TaxID=53985 RepID=A0A6A3Y5V6_9STRA|nr:hypothetical protein PF004_g25558 [Phytophthora fragariae]KAE9212646.1 hypothetical protein PF002_g18191 [Phytophthora fragariae]KAE9276769.1 hypothetical protein PF001_g25974 [Phytophthora fragariae]
MASRPPPPPSSFPGIAVDDMLALPGIQEVLTTDAPEVQDEVTSEEGAGSSSVVFRPSEELDSEKQPLGERKTTRSIPACIATSAITERSGLEAPTQDQVQLQSPQNKKRQHIRVPSVAELDELRHKLQANATTVGHDKHQKLLSASRRRGSGRSEPSWLACANSRPSCSSTSSARCRRSRASSRRANARSPTSPTSSSAPRRRNSTDRLAEHSIPPNEDTQDCWNSDADTATVTMLPCDYVETRQFSRSVMSIVRPRYAGLLLGKRLKPA